MAERITGHTELIGLMAYPIRHSNSPAMQNEAFAKLGYDYAYLAFEVGADEIEDAVKAIRTLKMRGSNVSMPNKTLVGKYLDELSPAAELCGAVNTIVNDNGHLTGHITDGIGFMSALKDNDIDVIGKKMTIVGAGGSGGALALAVGNEVWMMENATYTILSPEGFASILWKDSRKAPEAAEVMKVTAAHLKELGIIERIIPEEYPASEENLPEIAEYMKIRMKQFLEKQTGKSGLQIAQERYERFRKM